jgi:hypothetical protein
MNRAITPLVPGVQHDGPLRCLASADPDFPCAVHQYLHLSQGTEVLQTLQVIMFEELLAQNDVDILQGISAPDGVFVADVLRVTGAPVIYGAQ